MNSFQADLRHTCSAYPMDCNFFTAYAIHFVNALTNLNIIVMPTCLLTNNIITNNFEHVGA